MRIAFIGRAGHTLPSHRALLNAIAKECSVTVYSEVPLEREWVDLKHEYSLRATVARKWPRRIRDLILFLTLVKDHMTHRFDVIHAHSTYPAGFVAVIFQIIFRIPSVVSLDAAEGSAFPDIGFGDLLSRNRSRLNRWVIQRAAVVTALTDFHRREVVTNLGIRREIRVIPRGVDPGLFYPDAHYGNRGSLGILAVGYLNSIKDPITLLHAFHLINKEMNCHLIVVGKDYMQGAVQKLADDLHISDSVRFEGPVSHDRIPECYRRADVLLHTSRYESQGMAIAEALACGVPVVGTRVGLVSDLAGSCCVAVDPGDPHSLALAVRQLFADPQRLSSMRENAKLWSSRNTLQHTRDRVIMIYRDLMRHP